MNATVIQYLARLYAHENESNFVKKFRLEMEIQAVKQSGFPHNSIVLFYAMSCADCVCIPVMLLCM